MRNYNSSQAGVPYVRVSKIIIEYPEPYKAVVTCTEVEAVKLADNSVRKLVDLGELRFEVNPNQMADVLNVVNPDDGSVIPDTTVTKQQVMLGILAVIRDAQTKQYSAQSIANEDSV